MKRVLYLEDDEDLREMIALALEDEGFQVETSVNGLAGLEAMSKSKFDLLLIDVNMPLMGGIEFLQKIRKDGITIPAIFFSGHLDKEAFKKLEGIAHCVLLSKNCDVDAELLPLIKTQTQTQTQTQTASP